MILILEFNYVELDVEWSKKKKCYYKFIKEVYKLMRWVLKKINSGFKMIGFKDV